MSKPSVAHVEKRVREAIAAELRKITPGAYPNLYERTRTQTGYEQVEKTIISMMISQSIGPAACITNLETDYSQ